MREKGAEEMEKGERVSLGLLGEVMKGGSHSSRRSLWSYIPVQSPPFHSHHISFLPLTFLPFLSLAVSSFQIPSHLISFRHLSLSVYSSLSPPLFISCFFSESSAPAQLETWRHGVSLTYVFCNIEKPIRVALRVRLFLLFPLLLILVVTLDDYYCFRQNT